MTCDSEALVLDLDVVTALGIVVTELVTNSYDHAFPAGKGAIIVSARRADADMATTLTEFSQAQNAYKAALQSGASVLNLSILNYLQ